MDSFGEQVMKTYQIDNYDEANESESKGKTTNVFEAYDIPSPLIPR
jgi:hypothetical protein